MASRDEWEEILNAGAPVNRDIPPQTDDEEDSEWNDVKVEDWLGSERRCASRPRVKPVQTLRIRRPGKHDRYVSYYGFDGEGENGEIRFIAGAHRLWEIVITGRNLTRLMNYLKEFRVDWIRQAERPHGYGDRQLCIEKIQILALPQKKLEDEHQPGKVTEF